MRVLEICVDNYESALKAAKSGADRLELCQDLSVGGLTPTAGFISVVKKLVSVPVYVLIRPRPGNFNYNTYEVDQMLEDIKISKEIGADGLVFGALNKKNEVDLNVCQKLLAESSGLPSTFHRVTEALLYFPPVIKDRNVLVLFRRSNKSSYLGDGQKNSWADIFSLGFSSYSFDQIDEKMKALEDVIQLGFKRILTSGGSDAAETGVDTLKNLVLKAGERIIIMPGGNINDGNISNILQVTNASEFHSSGRGRNPNSPSMKTDVCSDEIVKNMRKILDSAVL